MTKSVVTILTSTSATAGTTTKSSPAITGTGVDCRAYNGGVLSWKITNGGSPPTVPLQAIFQTSHDNTNWYDDGNPFSGDSVSSSVNTGSFPANRGTMYQRIIAWGNTTNNVTIEAYLQAIT